MRVCMSVQSTLHFCLVHKDIMEDKRKKKAFLKSTFTMSKENEAI